MPSIPTPLNILMVTEYFPPKIFGGGELEVSLLAKHLVQNGYANVDILTTEAKNMPPEEMKEGVRIFRYARTGEGPRGLLANLKRSILFKPSLDRALKKVLLGKRYDIIHFMNGTSIVGAGTAKRNSTAKTVMHINSPLVACPKGDLLYFGQTHCKIKCDFNLFLRCQARCSSIGKAPNRFYLKYNPVFLLWIYARFSDMRDSLSHIDASTAVSKSVCKDVSKGIKNKTCHLLPNIIECEKFMPKKIEAARTAPKLLYVGPNLSEAKGPKILLESLKEMKEPYECNIYGEGNEREELEKIIGQYGLNCSIHRPVEYSKLPDIYKEHDIVIFPSTWPEPFGRVAVEAMAAGKIIIASDIGGISEIITDNMTGFLVKPNNPSDLGTRIRYVLTRLDSLKGIRENAIAESDKYSPKNISAEAYKIYKKILV